MMTSEYAPSMRRSVCTSELAMPPIVGCASIMMMISLSTVVWKTRPRLSSSSRSAAALVRLPLCAMAIWPRAQSTVSGWALRRLRGAGRRIARVADGAVADEVVQDFRVVENLRHEAHAVMLVKFPLVAGDDAGAFLAAMLQRVKAVVGQFGGVRMAENAEHTAIMFGIMWLSLHRARR